MRWERKELHRTKRRGMLLGCNEQGGERGPAGPSCLYLLFSFNNVGGTFSIPSNVFAKSEFLNGCTMLPCSGLIIMYLRTTSTLKLFSLSILFFKGIYLFIFRGRDKEWKRKFDMRKKHWSAAYHTYPDWGLACHPSMCPDLESNQRPLALQYNAQPT